MDRNEILKNLTAEITASIGDGELSEEDLESVAGGWSWDSFIGGATGGAIVGSIIGGIVIATNPVGWVIAAGAGIAVATTAAIGTYAGLTG